MEQQVVQGRITDSELIAFANECARYYRIPVVFINKYHKKYGDVRLGYKLLRDAEHNPTERQLSNLIGYICFQVQQNLRLEKLSGFADAAQSNVTFHRCRDCGIPLFAPAPAEKLQCFKCSLADKVADKMQVDLSDEDPAEPTSVFDIGEDPVEPTSVFDAPVDTTKLFGRYAAISTVRGKIQVDRVGYGNGVRITLIYLGEPYHVILLTSVSDLQDEFDVQLGDQMPAEHITLKRCLKRYK